MRRLTLPSVSVMSREPRWRQTLRKARGSPSAPRIAKTLVSPISRIR
jgi:hypothetical protein